MAPTKICPLVTFLTARLLFPPPKKQFLVKSQRWRSAHSTTGLDVHPRCQVSAILIARSLQHLVELSGWLAGRLNGFEYLSSQAPHFPIEQSRRPVSLLDRIPPSGLVRSGVDKLRASTRTSFHSPYPLTSIPSLLAVRRVPFLSSDISRAVRTQQTQWAQSLGSPPTPSRRFGLMA